MEAWTEQTTNYDEMSMQQSIRFADSLKDLKNLRTQLYSAAEYFELSYKNDNQKQAVVETLKDYTVMALVNTVDHLGSVTNKVNNLLNEKVEEVSGTEAQVSCIEQRFRTCQEYTDREGLAQQSSNIDIPRFHKRYVLPVGERAKGTNLADLKVHGCNSEYADDWYQYMNGITMFTSSVRGTEIDTPSSSFRKGRSVSPSLRPSSLPGTFSFSGNTRRKDQDTRSVSPTPHRFPLVRSGSLATIPTAPKPSGPTTPRRLDQWQNPTRAFRSASMRVHDEWENRKEIQRQPSKGKRLLKSLLSKRKSKKDDTLYTYLDEY